jgi:hypothetical protein
MVDELYLDNVEKIRGFIKNYKGKRKRYSHSIV